MNIPVGNLCALRSGESIDISSFLCPVTNFLDSRNIFQWNIVQNIFVNIPDGHLWRRAAAS